MSVEISLHVIEKLTHDTEEIRLRALDQIETKFARAQSHKLSILFNPTELCVQLIRWFGCKPLQSVEKVLELLECILEEYGEPVINKLGVPRLKCELGKIRKLLNQISIDSKTIDKIEHLFQKYDKIPDSEEENFAGIMEKLTIAEEENKTEDVFMFDPEYYEITWSKPTTADYNSLKFMADVLTSTQSTDEEKNNALEYLQVTMPDFPAEYMLQSPHILVKLLWLLEQTENLNDYLKNHVVTVLRIFLKSLKQRLHKRRKINSYSKQRIQVHCKTLIQSAMSSKSQLKITKAVQLLMKTFLDQLEADPLSTRTYIIRTIEAFEDILIIVDMQHLSIDSQLIVRTEKVLIELKNICDESEQYTTLARTRHLWLIFILHDMCILNAKRSKLHQFSVLKTHLCDYSLQMYFPKRSNGIKKLLFSNGSDIEQSYELLKTYEARIQCAIVLLKDEGNREAENILQEATKILPVLDTLQSIKLVRYIFTAILDCIRLYPSQNELKLQALRILHELLLLRHIPLKCDIYRSIAMAIKKHFAALMNNEHYSEGIQNQSLLSASVLGVPLNMEIVQQIVHDSYDGNPVVMSNAEEIILLLLRSYNFYGAEWNTFLEILLPVLPLIQSFSYSKEICEVLLKILDPDSKHLPFLALLRGNITFMFSSDASVRSEVLTRLVYMLNSLPQCSEYIPSIMEISDLLPNDLCVFEISKDLRHVFAASESYFELPAMHNLLTLLDTPDIEPCVRKTALLQLDVICKNWDMTALFCQEQAHCLILRVLENSLKKESSNDYVENIVPTIRILSKLLICDKNFCKELADIPNVYVLLLRAMFHYSQSLQVRQDTSICLFLLLFRNFLIINQEDSTVEAPLVFEKIKIPLKCKLQSRFTLNNCSFFNSPQSQLTSLFFNELEWNTYMRQVILRSFCGSSTFSKQQIDQMSNILDICPPLLIQKAEIRFLQATDTNFIMRNLLKAISNATDQKTLVRTANSLYLQLIVNRLEHGSIQLPIDIMDSIFSTFSKYLQINPGNSADFEVYRCSLELLHLCVRSSLEPIIRNLIHMLRSNIHHGVFTMLKNSDLPLNVYFQLNEFCCDLLSASATNESNQKQGADSIFRCNLFELLHEMTLQYYASRKFPPVRCLLKILKNLTNSYLTFPEELLFKYSKSFLQLSRELRSSSQTGTQWHRDCLVSFIQIFIYLSEDIKAMVSSNMLKHLIGLCGHNDAEVCALAWVCLGNIASIEVERKSSIKNQFRSGAEFLTHELSYLPGGFIGSCLCTFLSNAEINLVRNLAGNLFVLLLNKVCTFQKALELLELHSFFAIAHSSLETCMLEEYFPLNSLLLTVPTSDVYDPMEITTCEMVTIHTRICIAILKLHPEFVEELCEKPLLFKLFELLKYPMKNSNVCQYEMCADICQLYAMCSKNNFIFLQRTLCHDERWLLCFFEMLEIPPDVADCSIVGVLQLLLVICREDFVYKMLCKKLTTKLSLIQNLSIHAFNIRKTNTLIQRYTLAVFNFLLIKSQSECSVSSLKDPPHFCVLLESEVILFQKSSEMRTNDVLVKKKLLTDETDKENIAWNTCLKIVTKKESHKNENKKKKTKTDGIEKQFLSTLIFIDLFNIFGSLYPCNTCKFENSPSFAKAQLCETLALFLKLTPHSRLVAKNLKLFDKVIQILKSFFEEFNSCSTTYVRRYGELKKIAIIKNFQILFNIILSWFSPNAAILTDEVDCLEFSKIITHTWPWLTHSLELKLLILKVCSFLSERSLAVCRQFSILISTQDHSILQLTVKAVISETQKTKPLNDSHLSIVNTGLRVMMNCCACTEGRFTMNKEHVLNVIDGMYPIPAKSSKIRNDILNSWLQFWELFSRYNEGGKSRNINILCALIDRNPPCSSVRLFCLKILRNMCFLSNNRYQLSTSSEFIGILYNITTQPFSNDLCKNVSFEEQLITCVSIWQLISGGVKYMAMLRGTKLASELHKLHEKLTYYIEKNSQRSGQCQFAADVINILDIIFNIFFE